MKKESKDYLHLYLGAECWVQGQAETHPLKLTGISYDDQVGEIWCYFENTETGYALLEDVKPILRPLSDINDKEARDCWFEAKIRGGVTNCKHALNGYYFPDCTIYQMSLIINWLRRNGFDVDGLIESGLAIDSTKTP